MNTLEAVAKVSPLVGGWMKGADMGSPEADLRRHMRELDADEAFGLRREKYIARATNELLHDVELFNDWVLHQAIPDSEILTRQFAAAVQMIASSNDSNRLHGTVAIIRVMEPAMLYATERLAAHMMKEDQRV